MESKPKLQGKRILVVDDEPDLREILCEEFAFEGATVFAAEGGKAALTIATREALDAVVSDIRMPGGGGVELLEALRAQNPERPVVLLITGFSDLTPDEAYQKGAEAVLAKPFDMAELVSTVYRSLLPKQERWQRKHERVATELNVVVRGESLATSGDQQALNIGRGGLFVHAVDPLPQPGAQVSFEITFPENSGTSRIAGVGVVRWVRPPGVSPLKPGYGIEFLSLESSSIERIEKFCRQAALKAFIPQE